MAAGNRKKTSGVHFCQKRGLFSLLNFRKFREMFLLILTLFRMLKIAGRVILKTRNSSATTILLMSRTMKIRKLKLFYCQKNARYWVKELWRDIFLGNLSLKEGKNSVGLPVLILEFWWRHVQTKNNWSRVLQDLHVGSTLIPWTRYQPAHAFFHINLGNYMQNVILTVVTRRFFVYYTPVSAFFSTI